MDLKRHVAQICKLWLKFQNARKLGKFIKNLKKLTFYVDKNKKMLYNRICKDYIRDNYTIEK